MVYVTAHSGSKIWEREIEPEASVFEHIFYSWEDAQSFLIAQAVDAIELHKSCIADAEKILADINALQRPPSTFRGEANSDIMFLGGKP